MSNTLKEWYQSHKKKLYETYLKSQERASIISKFSIGALLLVVVVFGLYLIKTSNLNQQAIVLKAFVHSKEIQAHPWVVKGDAAWDVEHKTLVQWLESGMLIEQELRQKAYEKGCLELYTMSSSPAEQATCYKQLAGEVHELAKRYLETLGGAELAALKLFVRSQSNVDSANYYSGPYQRSGYSFELEAVVQQFQSKD